MSSRAGSKPTLPIHADVRNIDDGWHSWKVLVSHPNSAARCHLWNGARRSDHWCRRQVQLCARSVRNRQHQISELLKRVQCERKRVCAIVPEERAREKRKKKEKKRKEQKREPKQYPQNLQSAGATVCWGAWESWCLGCIRTPWCHEFVFFNKTIAVLN